MNYGVVIVTYNRIELLKECINAIKNQTLQANKIVIINNNSTDGTEEYLALEKNENFIVENVNENKGSSYGFSRGIEILRDLDVDWQLIIDDDAIIDKDYMLNISKHINENFKAYSGTVMQSGKPAIHHRRILDFSKIGRKMLTPIKEEEYNKEVFEYEITSFCGLVIKNDLVKKMDLPKRELFTQYTDTEYSIRLRKYTKVLNVNNAILNHKVNPSGKMKVWKKYYTERNLTYVLNNLYKNKFNFKIYLLLSTTKICTILFLKGLFSKDKEYIFGTIKAIYCGTKDGLKGKLGKNEKFLPGLKL